MTLKPIDALELRSWFKAVIYGPEGVGKTTWAGENIPDPVWLDFEKSSESLKSKGLKGIDVIEITPHHKPQEVVAFCKEIEKTKYKTLVLDTISTAQIFQLEDHMASVAGRDTPLFQDYRQSTQLFTDMFYRLQHANIHVVLIAHEREYFVGPPESKKHVATGPAITPALHDSVDQMVSAVLRLQKEQPLQRGGKPTWSMLCNSKGLLQAKNRYGILDVEVKNPTWDTFMNRRNENAID